MKNPLSGETKTGEGIWFIIAMVGLYLFLRSLRVPRWGEQEVGIVLMFLAVWVGVWRR